MITPSTSQAFSPADLQSPGLQVFPKTPVLPASPPSSVQSFNPLGIPKAEAQSIPQAPAPQPKPVPPAKFTPDVIQGWINQGTSIEDIYHNAYKLDPKFQRNVDYQKSRFHPEDPSFWETDFPKIAISKQYFKGQDLPKIDPMTAGIIRNAKESLPAQQSQQSDGSMYGDAMQNVQNISQAVQDYGSGKQGILNTAGQVAGNTVSGVLQPVSHTFNALLAPFQAVSGALGDAAEGLGHYLGGTQTGQQVNQAVSDALSPAHEAVMQPLGALVKAAQEHANDPTVKTAKVLGQAAMDVLQAVGMYHAGGAALDMAAEGAGKVSGVAGNVAQKIPGVSGVKNYLGDRAAFSDAQKASTPLEKLSMPAMRGEEIDNAPKNGRMSIPNAKGQPMAFTHGPQDTIVSQSLAKIPEFKDMMEKGIDPNANPTKANEIIQSAKEKTFGPAVQNSAKQIKFAFSSSDVKGLLKDTFERLNENGKVIATTEPVWEKTMGNYVNKFSKYVKSGMSPSEALWKTGSDMRLSVPESTADSTTSAQGAAIRAFTRAANNYLTSNAERIASTLDDANPAEAAKYRQFNTAMKDYSNISQAEENVQTKMPNKAVAPPLSPSQYVKGVAGKLIKPAMQGAGLGVATHIIP